MDAFEVRYLWTFNKSGQDLWTGNHDNLVVYGTLVLPDITSETLISPTQELLVSFTKAHTEQFIEVHSTGFREAKSLNRFELPLMCSNSTLNLVAIDKKVVTFGLELNFPFIRFL